MNYTQFAASSAPTTILIVLDLGIQKTSDNLNCYLKNVHKKCPVYLKLPCIGNISLKFEEQCKSAISICYGGANPCVIFSTKKMLFAIRKDVVPTIQKSLVVYQYVRRCDCRYVGRTYQRLQSRIKQHVPKSIRSKLQPERLSIKRECKSASQLSPTSYSAIGQYLLENKDSAIHYNDKQFSILAHGNCTFIFPL